MKSVLNTITLCSMNYRNIKGLLSALVLAVALSQGTEILGGEQSDYYRTDTIPVPEGIVLEAGALQWLGDNQMAVSTRLGEIYIVDNALAENPSDTTFHLFASGLHEVLGLAKKDDWIYCVQRCELTRMKDLDHDGRADVFETVNDDWGITGD